MGFLSSNHTFYAAIVTTVLVLFVSTWYICKRLFAWRRIRKCLSTNTQQLTPTDSSERQTDDGEDAVRMDAANEKDATDGDDEADDEELDRLAHMTKLQRLRETHDPVSYCEHIQGEVKRVKQKLATKRIQETLTQEQIDEEKKVQQQQLEAIFKLMQEQSEKFGLTSMDDVQDQMSLYNL